MEEFQSPQIRSLILEPNEDRSAEYKAPGDFEAYKFKIARAVLGLSNLRDGGYLIIGFSETPAGLTPVGLSDEEFGSYNVDQVLDRVSSYLSQPVELKLGSVTDQGKRFVVLRVSQFRRTPSFAKKSYGNHGDSDRIIEGAIYYRPAGVRPQTRVAKPEDMDELLDVALEYRLGEFVSRAERSDVALIGRSDDRDSLIAQVRQLVARLEAADRGPSDPNPVEVTDPYAAERGDDF